MTGFRSREAVFAMLEEVRKRTTIEHDGIPRSPPHQVAPMPNDEPITEINLPSPATIRARLATIGPKAELFDEIYNAALVGTAKRVQEDHSVAVYALGLLRSLALTHGDRLLVRRLSGEGPNLPYNRRKDTDVIFLEGC